MLDRLYDLFCLGCLLLLLVAGRASLVNNKGGVMAVRACALISCALLAVLLHSSQHSELLGIDSLIMKCGICGSQIMVLILARDTTHWAVRVLSSSSVPAHLPINWLEGA